MYQLSIRETLTNEGFTYWTDALTLDAFKAIKKELVEQVERYGTEHELTITRILDNQTCHFLGASTEQVITKIKARGLLEFERLLNFLR